MKRLILLVAASLILASPAFAWKEKVYRIEWSEWGLKDGMKSEQIAKQLDKNGVKYHPFEVSHVNSYFPSKMFQIDSVQRWGITWDKVMVDAQKNILGCVTYRKTYPDREVAMDVISLLRFFFEETNGFQMDETDLNNGILYSCYLFYSPNCKWDAPHHFGIKAAQKYNSDKYEVTLELYSYNYNPILL